MSLDQIENNGMQLRKALEETYQTLRREKLIKPGLHGTDITNVVLEYIPVGIPFKDAEMILQSAGFALDPHPSAITPPSRNRPNDWYAIVASISPFTEAFLSRTDLYVSLLPPAPGKYTVVANVSAAFYVSLP